MQNEKTQYFKFLAREDSIVAAVKQREIRQVSFSSLMACEFEFLLGPEDLVSGVEGLE